MRLTIIESPFAGDVEKHKAYAKRAVHDALLRGEAPIASHLLFTQEGVLDDAKPDERKLGIEAGLAWYQVAQLSAVYLDCGQSHGMIEGQERATAWGVPIEYRFLEPVPLPERLYWENLSFSPYTPPAEGREANLPEGRLTAARTMRKEAQRAPFHVRSS